MRRIVLGSLMLMTLLLPLQSAHAAGCMPCPPGPAPRHFGPYGGFDLWNGTCPPLDTARPAGRHPYGEITTHWDEYRGTASVRFLEIAASFSDTSTAKTPSVGKGYTNVFDVLYPAWGRPIDVGMGYAGSSQNVGRHQDGPLYLVFRARAAHSVIAVTFLWLDARRHVLWQSLSPLYWRC